MKLKTIDPESLRDLRARTDQARQTDIPMMAIRMADWLPLLEALECYQEVISEGIKWGAVRVREYD